MMRLIRYFMNPKSKKLRKNTYFAVASVVVFVTTYILILPAITKSTDVFCGHEAHIHSESCYSEDKVLVCSKEESEGHEHGDSCYKEQTELICELEEKAGHSHEESCYEEESILVCTDDSEEHEHDESCYKTERKLVCGLNEEEGHFHNKDCYTSKRILTCGLEEEKGHKHNEDCYEIDKKMSCDQEEHEHNLMCYSNPKADFESQSQWEKSMEKVELTGEWSKDILLIADSQLGYHESTENYIVNESGKKKGYSRYGEWYGDRYGDWCAMFVSFCIRYADIPSEYMPIEAGCQRWIETMNSKDFPYYYAVNDENDYKLLNDSKDFEPISGDIIFFNWDSYSDSDHVGIVYEVKKDKDGHIEEIKTIEGNSSDVVKYNTYLPDDEKIMGYARMPENPDYIPETEVASESGTVAESETDAATESETEEVVESQTEQETEATSETETSAETETDSEAETSAETETTSKAETSAETESTSEAETPAETEAVSETESMESATIESSEAETEGVTEESTEVASSEEETSEATSSEEETEESIEVDYQEPVTKTVDGSDYHISVTYTKEAELPKDVELQARELEGKEYDKVCKEAMEAMGASEITFARFFDISFLSDGNIVEPKGMVTVQITYDETVEVNEGEISKAVHFAEEGTQVLDVAQEETEEGTSFLFEQDSFSVTGTMVMALAAAPTGSTGSGASAPAVGAVTGTNVTTPVVGDWYVLYGYIPDNAKYNVGQAISATNPTTQVPLNQVSANGGTVAYNGQLDIAWQYTENGFRNRNGQYLTIQNINSYWLSTVGVNTATTYAKVKYSSNYHILYNTQEVDNAIAYNKIYMHAWEGVTEAVKENFLGEVQQTAAPIYIARLTYEGTGNAGDSEDGDGNMSTADARHPQCAITGTPDLTNLTIYSMYASDNGLEAVPGVVYTVYDRNGKAVKSIATDNSYDLSLGRLSSGTYTVKQTSVPDGYVLNPEVKTFTVDNDGYAFIGSFFVYKKGEDGYQADKTAEYVDYVNRVYKVDLTTSSGAYKFNMDTINYSLIVDQSNSMLFPAELTSTGKTVSFNAKGATTTQGGFYNGCYINKSCQVIEKADGSGAVYGYVTYDRIKQRWVVQWRAKINGEHIDLYTQYSSQYSNGSEYIPSININSNGKTINHQAYTIGRTQLNNTIALDSLNLDKNKVYYVIADEAQSSTVYAIWHDGNGWIFQDSAYYAKAQFSASGLPNSTENGGTVTYAQYNSGYSVGTAYGGGDIDVGLGGTLAADIAAGKNFTIYTGSTYNRLHELQQAVAAFATQLASLNEDATLDLITFDREVESCRKDIPLNPSNVKTVINYVNAITTSGGTRQEKALRHLIGTHSGTGSAEHSNNHLNDGENIVILITDGAPVKSGGDSDIVENDLITAADEIEAQGVDLTITVGLSMKSVQYGTQQLQGAATSTDWYFPSESTGELTDILVKKILFKLGEKELINSSADIKDVISDSFYPVNPANNEPLKNGDRIALDGSVNSNGPGTVKYDSTIKEWYVEWDNQAIGRSGGIAYTYTDDAGVKTQLDTSTIYYIDYGNKKAISGSGPFDSTRDKLMYSNGQWIYRWRDHNGDTNRMGSVGSHVSLSESDASWHGSIYLKAKEDFIGGNSIDTNKSATVAIKDEQGNSASISLPTPNVNVRLLPFEGFESEETVFLGDEVSKIKEKLQMLLHKTVFDKITDGEGNNLNYKDWTSTESGCYAENFSIPYSIGELTEANWADLFNGNAVTVDYTYDDDSSHGPVGYFTFSLSKEAVAGEPSDYAGHETEVSGQNVEQYKLTVIYTAYKIGEQNRPGNVHNTTKGPGTEVGTGQSLEDGKGTESVDEIHYVHVVPGKIKVTKNIDNTLVSNQDQVFTFYLTREGETEASYSINVTIKAGETSGSAEFTMANKTEVKRGDYVLSEGTSDLYNVASVSNETDTTCSFGEITDGSESLLYKIGTNKASKEEDHNVIHVNQTPEYSKTSKRYVYSVVSSDITEENISYGHGVINNTKTKYAGEIPVKKVWADGKEHGDDLIYVVLCKDNIPVLSTEGQAQMICLNPANGWEGTFQVGMESKTDDLTQAGYSILEVKDMLDTQPEKDGYTTAVLLGTDQIKYVSLASENDLISVGGITYKVSYESSTTSDQRKAAAGKNAVVSLQTLVVKNTTAYELPQTGGVGTRRYTMGGMFLIMAALVLYGFGQRRRRERRFD